MIFEVYIIKGTSFSTPRLVNKFGTFILLSDFSWHLTDFQSVAMPDKAIFRSALISHKENYCPYGCNAL